MKVKDYWLTALWALVILVLAVVPSNKIPDPPDWNISADKIVHLAMFAILSILLLFARDSNDKSRDQIQLVQALLLLIFYGFLLELMQLLIPARDFSWLDFIADATGVIAGNYIYLGIVKLKKGLDQ